MKDKYSKILSDMIKIETVSAEGQTDLRKFRKFHTLLKKKFPKIFAVCEVTDYDGSLLMRWPGKNSPEPENQGILLMNHMDVVEATGEWKYPPFSGEIAEGKVWGRGALDDKGELFAMLQAAEELAADGFVPERDIWFESACTEEIAGHGADEISKMLAEKGYRFEMVLDEGGMIVDEPIAGAKGTYAMIGVGEKGFADIKFIAKSAGGHASAPPKDTPLVRLGKFMSYVDRHEIFDVEISPAVCEMLKRLSASMEGASAKAMANPEKFAPIIKKVMAKSSPMSAAMTKTTIAFTCAKGANGYNVIPEEAYVIGNMRYSHHQGRDASIEAISKVAKRYNLEVEVIDPGLESPISDWNSRGFKLIESGVAEIFEGVTTSPFVTTGASDARYMTRVSDNCFRFAPFKVTDKQMSTIHGLNENVDIDSLEPAVEFYKYIIRNFDL
ncbi:MAG: M20/M25/M40 family metallo-hydrolase [Firmicutes bacterium]|nr:M20/M25/M40 family metallo-hydrolase [Bacillota bacterium]